jgi:hypothetical protein
MATKYTVATTNMYQMVIKIPTSSIAKQKLPKFGFLV